MEDRLSQRYTDRARRVMAFANLAAHRHAVDAIGPEHMLLGLIALGETDAPGPFAGCVMGYRVLRSMGFDTQIARRELAPARGEQGHAMGSHAGRVGKYALRADAQQALSLARDEALALGHDYVGTEHLLLGLIRSESAPVATALRNQHVTLDAARACVAAELARFAKPGSNPGPSIRPAGPTQP